MKLIPIVPECFKMDGGACFGVVPKSIWSKHVPSDENNMVNLSSRCLLVETDDRLVLIDTGMGNKQSEKYYSYFFPFNRIGLESALLEKGYSPEEVTDVILTHLHFDHVGGALKWDDTGKAVTVLPNATYYCSKAQWDTAQQPNPREKASFFPENYDSLFHEGRIEFLYENGPLFNGIDIEIMNGHTLGLIVPIIHYKEHKVVYTADFIATMFNIPLPYVPSFDIDPLTSMREKEEFYKRAINENVVLFLSMIIIINVAPLKIQLKESELIKFLQLMYCSKYFHKRMNYID
jgi:glyoxylase-like metal-dependent hydrolase (beta-lactamase superfamily II)